MATPKDKVCDLYKKGLTLQQVGDFFNVSRERIRQILRECGVPREAGGRTLKASMRRASIKRKRNLACIKHYGCPLKKYNILRAFNGDAKKTPINFYNKQKSNAKTRGVPWKLTLWEWWQVWRDSGKYDERYRSKSGYCMARFKDRGPYSKDNVYITTLSQNVKDYYVVHGETHRQLVLARKNK